MRTTRACRSAGATSARPRWISSPFLASRTSMAQILFSRWAYIPVNPGGICWTITMPGMSAGSRLSTSRVASVPPVEAPSPMMVWSRFMPLECPSAVGGATGAAGAVAVGADVEAAAWWAAAWMRQGETLAQEATTIFWDRERRKDSRLSTPSGLRTKSTAPAASASKTRRFRLDTRITGSGCSGRSCRRKSMPLVPGISTSSVITSGWRRRIFVFASRALMA